MWTSLKHWWQRNFGYVFLTDGSKEGAWYRFRAKRGKVAFGWLMGTPFICRLAKDGTVRIIDKSLMGCGQEYGEWGWAYLDGIDTSDIPDGGGTGHDDI